MNDHGGIYGAGVLVSTDASFTDETDHVFSSVPHMSVKLAQAFMKASGPIEVEYESRTQPVLRWSFPSAGATKALKPLLASPLCGLE